MKRNEKAREKAIALFPEKRRSGSGVLKIV